MKSIQTKFIILILGCVILSSVIIGGAGIAASNRAADDDSARIMNLMCSDEAQQLNTMLSRVEQSVNTLSAYALNQFDSIDRLKNDPGYVEEYTSLLESISVDTASSTKGAIAVYFRFNPELTTPTAGLFWGKTNSSNSFQKLAPTDLSRYNSEDASHVGWYYTPIANGKATWMEPYMNENINIYMISYVIPIYQDGQVVGIVGMDIDFNLITDAVAKMQIYDSGYGFLLGKDAKVMYHKTVPIGEYMESTDPSLAPVAKEMSRQSSGQTLFPYQWNGENKLLAFRSLTNGMRLAIAAPASEINAEKNHLISQIVVAVLSIGLIAILLTIWQTRRLVKPLRELNEAAQKIADGDMSISITPRTKDEVGTLAESFQQTVEHLRKYIDYINSLAYRDSLTGVKNNTSYQMAVKRLEERMSTERVDFAVLMLDINELKLVNDTYGHDFGDMLIINCCRLICLAFKHSPVYRIGGDEFVVILEGKDYSHYPQLLESFAASIAEYNKSARKEETVSIARGIAVYSPDIDLVYGNVFKRADDAMYRNKTDIKSIVET